MYYWQLTLLGRLVGPTVIGIPWSQGPVISLGDAVVVHRVNMCTFIVSHMHLHSMLDNNVNAGKLILMQSALLMMSLLKVIRVVHLCKWIFCFCFVYVCSFHSSSSFFSNYYAPYFVQSLAT